MNTKKEIVAMRIGTQITNIPKQMIFAIEHDLVTELLDKPRMQFMAAADLGPQWVTLANSPVLFVAEYDDDGRLVGVFPPPAKEIAA